MSTFITLDFLNLRREPMKAPENIILTMPPDTIVEKIGEKSGWFQVKTLHANTMISGFAFPQFLKETTLPFPNPEPTLIIPPVHLDPGSNVIARSGTGRAFPLNEAGLRKVDLRQIADAAERRAQIGRIIDFLNVEQSARYAPNSQNTFCNIYAYDVVYCLGAFLPRVWWTSGAIAKILAEEQVKPVYDKTVTELNANRIADWFEQFGTSFGWKFLTDLTVLQQEANQGKLGVIVAQRVNQNFPGHVLVVPPETETQRATWSSGVVTSPLQSQAGGRNRKYFTNLNWWRDAKFKKFGYWVLG